MRRKALTFYFYETFWFCEHFSFCEFSFCEKWLFCLWKVVFVYENLILVSINMSGNVYLHKKQNRILSVNTDFMPHCIIVSKDHYCQLLNIYSILFVYCEKQAYSFPFNSLLESHGLHGKYITQIIENATHFSNCILYIIGHLL